MGALLVGGHPGLGRSRCSASACAGGWASGLGVLDGLGGAVLVAALGLGLVWLGGAVALHTPGARELREPIQRSAILQRAQRRAAAVGPDAEARSRASTRSPRSAARSPTCAPPDSRDRARPAGARGRRAAWSGCSAPPAGWACRAAAGWRATASVVTNAHVVAGQDDTTVQLGGDGRAPRRRGGPLRPAQRPRRPARARPRGRARAADRTSGARPGTVGRDPRLPRERPLRRAARPPRRDRRPCSPRTPTAAGRSAPDHADARPRALGQLGRARWSTARGRVLTTIFAATVSDGGRSGFGVPDSIVAEALGARRRAGRHRALRALSALRGPRATASRSADSRGDQLLGVGAQPAQVDLAGVVEVVARLGRARPGGASSARLQRVAELVVDRVGDAVEDDVEDRPGPLDQAPVLDLVEAALAGALARCRATAA